MGLVRLHRPMGRILFTIGQRPTPHRRGVWLNGSSVESIANERTRTRSAADVPQPLSTNAHVQTRELDIVCPAALRRAE